ncbi:hypothetical protein [Marinactinospora rubrisoli]|uniref:Uncharacterized protein n=1 Tax=Marinactinospora rubrisoli TaxID=2715399 RepID=A0ABW2KJ46_9ACTN
MAHERADDRTGGPRTAHVMVLVALVATAVAVAAAAARPRDDADGT